MKASNPISPQALRAISIMRKASIALVEVQSALLHYAETEDDPEQAELIKRHAAQAIGAAGMLNDWRRAVLQESEQQWEAANRSPAVSDLSDDIARQ